MAKSSQVLKPWSIRAINLPEHAHNPIHTDSGAKAAGFPAALVAGVTVYAYLTHPPMAAWGHDWLSQGGGELRLKKPVFEADTVECRINANGNAQTVAATVSDAPKATFDVWERAPAPAMRSGEELMAREMRLTEQWARYGLRAGDDPALYPDAAVAHPAIWPNLANGIFSDRLVSGPWIHTRSKIWHQGVARVGDALRIESTVIDRFSSRAGERAVVDMAISANGQPVVRIEHEALVSLS